MSWFVNPAPRQFRPPVGTGRPRDFHTALPGYAPTPLIDLPILAAQLVVGRLLVKDESRRFGLPAFKILGASWAIQRLLCQRAARTLVTATDGNHGRAVARVARDLGLAARVYLPHGVHPVAAAAITGEGATVVTTGGSYDDAVAAAATDASADPDAALVQDTAWPGYREVPRWIVEGYTTMFAEIDDQQRVHHIDDGVDHRMGIDLVVVPVGVGSLAESAVRHYRRAGVAASPRLLSVEPDAAPCVLASLVRGERVTVATEPTIMAGLNCGTPSELAWPVLRGGLDAACSVPDRAAAAAADELAAHGVSAGPCGAAGLAALRSLDHRQREQLGLTPDSTVVLLCTEGADANPAMERA